MTGDELASALYAEQGYLVLATTLREKIGAIAFEEGYDPATRTLIAAALRITGKATLSEYLAQCRLAEKLGEPQGPQDPEIRYFYRVEAAD